MHNGITTAISIVIGYYIIVHVAIAGTFVGDYTNTHDPAALTQAGIECTMSIALAACLIAAWIVNLCCGISELGDKLEEKSKSLEEC